MLGLCANAPHVAHHHPITVIIITVIIITTITITPGPLAPAAKGQF
ncbi:MAG: hypothetical protein MI749_12830 [Desulfovibrionales bacterium]|nr:hypothetical protein [Desulfovibrionales bacterium]